MHTTQHTKHLGNQSKAPALRRGPVPIDPALLHHVRGGVSAPASTNATVKAPRGKW